MSFPIMATIWSDLLSYFLSNGANLDTLLDSAYANYPETLEKFQQQTVCVPVGYIHMVEIL